MATPIFAVTEDNFNSDIWSSTPSGSVEPGLRPDVNSVVMANGHTVQVTANATVAEWRNGTEHGATAGGSFQAAGGLILGGHAYAYSLTCMGFSGDGVIDGATGGINAWAHGAYSEGALTVTNAIGGSGQEACGALSGGPMTVTNATGGSGAAGAQSSTEIIVLGGTLTCSPEGFQPLVAPKLTLKTPLALERFPLIDDQGVVHQFMLDDGVHPEHLPITANVKQGISYGPNNTLIGTCIIPPADKVAIGVPVDQTTGTAYLLDAPTPLQTLLKIRCLDEYGAPEKDVCVSIQLIGLSTTPSTGKAFSTVVNQRLSDDQGWVITTIPRQAGLRFRAARGINPMEEDWIMFTGVDLDILEIPSFFAK